MSSSTVVFGALTAAALVTCWRPSPAARRPTHSLSRGPARRRWRRPVLLAVLALVLTVVAGPFLTVLVGAILSARLLLQPRRSRVRRRRTIERDLPDTVDLLVLTIRSGLTPHQAVAAIASETRGPCAEGLAEVVRLTRRGHPFADAVAALRQQLGPPAHDLADALATSERYGLPLEPTLTRLSAEARTARRRLDEAEARRLPIRLSFPLVMCTLPSFVLLAVAPTVLAALSSLGGTTW